MNLTNELIAKTTVHYEKTIAVLTDERPGFDRDACLKIIDFLRDNGYYVHEVTAEELCNKTKVTLGFFLLIPHASSVPAMCAEAIRLYWEQGGQVITLGGTLFSKWIEKVDGKWSEMELANNEFDAAYSGKTAPIVIEGIVPSYKTYHYNNAEKFAVNNAQLFVSDNIEVSGSERFICPVARSLGDGYLCEHRNRYIPLVEIMGEGGRNGGKRGAAAFIMLSDTKGHLPFTNGNRPGSVSSTTFGSAIGSIGILEQDIMRIKGVPQVLLSMIRTMERGMYIFEAGADKPVYEKGEKPVIGAKLLNLSQDFEELSARFVVKNGDTVVIDRTETVLATPRSYTQLDFVWEDYRVGDYSIAVELIYNGEVIDRITQGISEFVRCAETPKDEFVTVEGNNFMLGGKPWYSWGMNYWPLYYPGFERSEYWMGWLDKSNYFPNEIEADMALMEQMGINTLYIRLDADVFGRSVAQFKDFLMRCKKHNMKLSLSYPNATCPLNYSSKAFRKLVEEFDLKNNPVLFTHDVAWELGHQLLFDEYRYYWDEPWNNWLIERYGSVENAESDFGCPVDRAADGRVISPPIEEFSNDGEWRVKIAAYRRFIDDHISRLWNPAMRDMRSVDPNHLYAFRKGPNQPQAVSFTIANKHIDYTSPEGYEVTHDEKGYHVSCANTMIMNLVSGNKPVIWSEYGLTLTGLRWTELIWDHEKEEPFAYRVEKTTSYIDQYLKMFRRMRVNGSAPWWWCGGFRMVEMSDCGFCGPDGVLRPFGRNYAANGDWFKNQPASSGAGRRIVVDPDANAGGYNYVCEELLWKEHKAAEEKGENICAVTEATGTNSLTAPLVAIGNVPYRGTNPPKYFNSEFNLVKLTFDGRTVEVKNGDEIRVNGNSVGIEVSVGNLQEPTWLAGKDGDKGAVFVVSDKYSDINVKMPIKADTAYLCDACADGELALGEESRTFVSLQMSVEQRAVFGEKFSFTLIK